MTTPLPVRDSRSIRITSRLGAVAAAIALTLSGLAVTSPATAAQVERVTIKSGRTVTLPLSEGKGLNGTASSSFQLHELPATGGGVYASVRARVTSAGAYALQTRVYPNGVVQASIKRSTVSEGKESVATLSSVSQFRLRLKAKEVVSLTLQVSETDARVGLTGAVKIGNRETATVRASDAAAVALRSPGKMEATYYASSSTPTLNATHTPGASEFTPSPTTSPRPTATVKPLPRPSLPVNPAPIRPTVAPSPSPSSSPGSEPPTVTPKPPTPPATEGGPDASNTGVPRGVQLKVHHGDLIVKTPHAVVEGLEVRGIIVIDAPGVVIRNTKVVGTSKPRTVGLVSNVVSGQPFTITDSEIFASTPSHEWNGIMGSNFTAERVNIHSVVDPVRVLGSNVVVRDSWLHRNLHYANDPGQNGGATHDDSIQIQAGTNIVIERNRMEGAHNAAIQITQDRSRATLGSIQIRDNYLQGGACTVNIGRTPSPVNPSISNNVFGPERKHSHCAVIAPHENAPNLSGNIWEQTGEVMSSFTPAR